MNKKLRPLVKWTGGKFDEFVFFSAHIPAFERYIEPFFGGGGVFFALQPQVPSLLNDKSTDLINFYSQLTNADFKNEIQLYTDAWDELGNLTAFLWKNCGPNLNLGKEQLQAQLDFYFQHQSTLGNPKFIIDFELFKSTLLFSIEDKAKRIKRISAEENREFTADELYVHFETGVRSGTYLFFRRILNDHYLGQLDLSLAKAVANWYFVREFCYASMFRFNAKGEFNIPYGGIAYNRKKFRKKAERIFTEPVTELFRQSTLSNADFEVFLTNASLKDDDFIFVDPPYDSEFSEYDQSAFTKKDQQRLASLLIPSPAKWMMVIKETPFIRQLYTHSAINITAFEKNYAYNVRGRNARGVTHLIIKNY